MKTITLLLITTILVVICKADYLEYRKVHLVDQTPPLSNGNVNYLFRGNEPKISVDGKDQFAYDELINCMVNNSLSLGVKFPPQFYLVDIKLTYNHTSELPDIDLEKTYFEANPSIGEFNTNITMGDWSDPHFIPSFERVRWATNLTDWQKDDLPARMELYRNILYTEMDVPLVLYIHCECGCDRTGEVFASYVMKYLGWSFKKAIDWDYQIAGRYILPQHQFAANWYCYWLYFVEKMDIDCSS